MRFSWIALAVFVGCSFNEVKPSPPPSAGPLVLNGEAVSAKVAPPPIAGGTLLVTKSGIVLAGNPDRGVVDVFGQETYGSTNTWAADFGADSQPGRMVEGEPAVVHVVLRGSGAIGTIDLLSRATTTRKVCPAPRGIAYAAKTLHVTCAGGELVTVPLDGGDSKTVQLDRDLRDILLDSQGGAWISRFRSAELLHVDAQGNVLGRAAPSVAPDRALDQPEQARYEPNTAWRIAMASDGAVYMLHQLSTTRLVATKSLPIEPPKNDEPPQQQSRSPYGGSGGAPVSPEMPVCDDQQLVAVAVTRFSGGTPSGTDRVTFSAPAVDMALGPGDQVFIAHLNGTVFAHFPSFDGAEPSCVASTATAFQGPVVGVALDKGALIAQIRDVGAKAARRDAQVRIVSPATRDSGHTIFHLQTAGGIACVSCHAEAGDDGHTWNFVDIGLRRTQSLRGGILATAPFHWNGDMRDISQLAHDVFTQRMGGDSLSEAQVGVLGSWIDRQPPLPAPTFIDAQAKARGAAIFASAGCQKCHEGDRHTSNKSEDVGSGATLQVPSLVNVGARAPFMHDGCAPTLMARLVDTKCGGSKHGDVAQLTAEQRSDLVSFLESL